MKLLLFTTVILISNHVAQAQSWEQLSPIPTVEDIVSSSFINSNEGWISTNSTVFKTSDGCQTWEIILGVPTPAYLSFLNSNVGYAKYSTSLYKTTDGGSTWSLTLPDSLTASFLFP
jgi:photosystem II stability/assembly factor-like uncharacterized protein